MCSKVEIFNRYFPIHLFLLGVTFLSSLSSPSPTLNYPPFPTLAGSQQCAYATPHLQNVTAPYHDCLELLREIRALFSDVSQTTRWYSPSRELHRQDISRPGLANKPFPVPISWARDRCRISFDWLGGVVPAHAALMTPSIALALCREASDTCIRSQKRTGAVVLPPMESSIVITLQIFADRRDPTFLAYLNGAWVYDHASKRMVVQADRLEAAERYLNYELSQAYP